MPVRKIPKNHLVVTGRMARASGEPAGFEGMLEADYLVLLKYDQTVASFDVQPVKVPVPGARPYTPDVLIYFKTRKGMKAKSPQLCEVKPKARLATEEAENEPKFAAARAYCKVRGWTFSVITEEDIPAVRLRNLRFLRGFQKHDLHKINHARVVAVLKSSKVTLPVEDVLQITRSAGIEDMEMIPSIWRGVISHQFVLDIDKPLSMQSKIGLP